LLATVLEMAFAGHTGVDLDLKPETPGPGDASGAIASDAGSVFAQLFSEELGAVIQVRTDVLTTVMDTLRAHGLESATTRIGALNRTHTFRITERGAATPLFEENLFALRAIWSDVTHRIAALRDNPACADSEFQLKLDPDNPGITPRAPKAKDQVPSTKYQDSRQTSEPPLGTWDLPVVTSRSDTPLDTWDLKIDPSRSTASRHRPRLAILREQGVNGQIEMAAATMRAGFTAVDVHMTDILSGRVSLQDFRGIIACGGFSYGDVLGAGEGWAKSVLFNTRARAEFAAFFAREDAFALGVCNGCQMMSNLKSLIPGADLWPRFVQNRSERFEARFASLRIEESPSVLFRGMEGAVIPIAVAHGEGYAEFPDSAAARRCSESGIVSARFVDNHHRVTEQYPLNPNGSPFGMTALTSATGRVTIMMPHPERVFRTVAMSWHPADWGEDSPWMQLFHNARAWVG
jgi:phosphoribosylformylglycinamidine synthase